MNFIIFCFIAKFLCNFPNIVENIFWIRFVSLFVDIRGRLKLNIKWEVLYYWPLKGAFWTCYFELSVFLLVTRVGFSSTRCQCFMPRKYIKYCTLSEFIQFNFHNSEHSFIDLSTLIEKQKLFVNNYLKMSQFSEHR